MKQYRAILLDMDNTLFDFDHAEQHSFFQVCKRYGIEADAYAYTAYHAINDYLWKELEKGRVEREHLRILRFSCMMKLMRREDVDAADFNEQYMDGVASDPGMFPGAADFCRTLLQRGYQLGIVTNGSARNQMRRLQASEISGLISVVEISENSKPKPEPDVFLRAAKQLAVRPEDTLVIGDSLPADIGGGIRAGMDTLWYCPQGKQPTHDVVPTYQAKSYDEILQLLP